MVVLLFSPTILGRSPQTDMPDLYPPSRLFSGTTCYTTLPSQSRFTFIPLQCTWSTQPSSASQFTGIPQIPLATTECFKGTQKIADMEELIHQARDATEKFRTTWSFHDAGRLYQIHDLKLPAATPKRTPRVKAGTPTLICPHTHTLSLSVSWIPLSSLSHPSHSIYFPITSPSPASPIAFSFTIHL